MRKLIVFLMFVLILVFAFPSQTVHADISPPEMPPGTNLLPGNTSTQVRMMAETVTLDVSKDPADSQKAIARTDAVFTMRNLGTTEEKMEVRFPMSFFNGNSDGFGNFPEITTVEIKVDGKAVSTNRVNEPFFNSDHSYTERDQLPWTVFNMTFPPSKDVTIEVTYTASGFGYYPYEVFRYILETGAGWNGTIGTADIIVRLPYEVNKKNVWMDGVSGYEDPTPGGVLNGNEIRWHFNDLEPTSKDNMQFIVVTPSLWESVLRETDVTTNNPKDGEAWGRLAKAYKEIIRMSKGYYREDLDGREMFQLSKEAYEKCLALLPNDPLWHYGYADLLWPHYYFDIYMLRIEDTDGILPTILKELQATLALDPNSQQAKDLLTEISYSIADVVKVDENNFTLLALTATPLLPTPYSIPSETPTLISVEDTPTSIAFNTPITEDSPAPNPLLCGNAFLLPMLLCLVFVFKRYE